MSYSEEALEELEGHFLSLRTICEDLSIDYITQNYSSDKAREFACHGLSRRLSLMKRSVERVFDLLPPASEEIPGSDVIHDATVHLQLFVMHTYGCLDNLAHIWVLEKNVKGKAGRPIPPVSIGFGGRCKIVRASLPEPFTEYLSSIEPWYRNLESFRNALAHRIPLYIPPGYLSDENLLEYRRIETRIDDAYFDKDFESVGLLREEQEALYTFYPVTTHSFEEEAGVVYFHAQMINDILTVIEIASRLFPYLGLGTLSNGK